MSVAPVEIVGEGAVPRLRAGALSLMDAVGQSLAAVGPTLTPALNITVVAGLAGVGCWMSYFFGTLGVVIVAASVGVLAPTCSRPYPPRSRSSFSWATCSNSCTLG
jgi:hypothetical protein